MPPLLSLHQDDVSYGDTIKSNLCGIEKEWTDSSTVIRTWVLWGVQVPHQVV